jgi:hypothetical protein
LETSNRLGLKRGDRVDILADSESLAEAIAVLRADAETVVVAADAGQIEVLEKRRQSGKLTLVLRNPEEKAGRPRRRPTAGTYRRKRVEIWSEEGE